MNPRIPAGGIALAILASTATAQNSAFVPGQTPAQSPVQQGAVPGPAAPQAQPGTTQVQPGTSPVQPGTSPVSPGTSPVQPPPTTTPAPTITGNAPATTGTTPGTPANTPGLIAPAMPATSASGLGGGSSVSEYADFAMLDVNHDGALSRAEVRRDASLSARFKNADADRDGVLSDDEFSAAMTFKGRSGFN